MYRNNEDVQKAKELEAQIKTKIVSMVELAVEIRNHDIEIEKLKTLGGALGQPIMFLEGTSSWDFMVTIARRYGIDI